MIKENAACFYDTRLTKRTKLFNLLQRQQYLTQLQSYAIQAICYSKIPTV